MIAPYTPEVSCDLVVIASGHIIGSCVGVKLGVLVGGGIGGIQ